MYFKIFILRNAIVSTVATMYLYLTVRLQCVQPTLPKYFSASEYLFFLFSCHVTALNLFDDHNCDV